ncbi:MAG TPA: molybdopterin oxidoreductase [Planctomycetes bacterium]|nr:molybdopterin oxidoreductase [Planctomycetota bacterium]
MSMKTSKREYWRSLEQLSETPQFQEMVAKEFPSGPEEDWTESSRRRFLQLMGASAALGAAGACSWKEEKILPFSQRPDGWIPGKTKAFATSMELGGVGRGLVVTCYDGRPIKVEGNSEHPESLGATDSFAQASVLELYDPDRSRAPFRQSGGQKEPSSWESFSSWVRPILEEAKKDGGKGLAILAEPTSSPSIGIMKGQVAEMLPSAVWVEYDPTGRHEEAMGLESCGILGGRPVSQFDKASVILCLDDDPLADHPAALRHAREFASGRKPEKGMNRLYSVETDFSVTGSMADHRLPLEPSRIRAFAAALEARLAGDADAGAGAFPDGEGGEFLAAALDDLRQAGPGALVTVGPNQPHEVHALGFRINHLLGSLAQKFIPWPNSETGGSADGLAGLVGRMGKGDINTLFVLGGNPAYNAPANLDFSAASQKVQNLVHLGLYQDETASLSTWHLPKAHFLESWGDSLSWQGYWNLAQPLIEPLHGGRSVLEFLSLVLGGNSRDGRAIVRSAFRREFGAVDLEGKFRKALHDGFATVAKAFSVGVVPEAVSAPSSRPVGEGLEVVFRADRTLHDGRFANSGWLQELPDPLTKLTWDNAALLAKSEADRLSVNTGDLVEVAIEGRSMELPIYIMPGHAPGSVTIPLGYGRKEAGHVAGCWEDQIEPVGFDSYRLRTSSAFTSGAVLAVLKKTGRTYPLATTQDHHLIDDVGLKGRADRLGELVREGDIAEWKEHADFAKHRVHEPPLGAMWDEHEYDGHKWGMSIDLSTCLGCSTCTVACQSENNIPVVGKEEVINGREMHWIRLDRYFQGDIESPEAVHQPVACQHCELAPCEQVCPVAATTHSSEGLNDMVYNRCIGTRYCANNCPYKVRRFNFFNFNKDLKEPKNETLKLAKNPEVTVRSRGVMEKCSFCVQRIEDARGTAKIEGRPLVDGDVTPACAQACPTDSIQFGDLNDEASKVRMAHDDPRSYFMLGELSNKPRTAFLARIRNPNPALEPKSSSAKEEAPHG